uniref:Uncharacterized protein n=1 Tax=Arundo donax TaxID=35708 RepID=A0A0A9FU47_ARUDO
MLITLYVICFNSFTYYLDSLSYCWFYYLFLLFIISIILVVVFWLYR